MKLDQLAGYKKQEKGSGMKKMIVALIVLCLSIPGISLAQTTGAKQGPVVQSGPVRRGATRTAPAAAGPRRSFGLMMGILTSSKMVSSDDGVIIMVGNKLLKYDKDLNLLKEVEVKIDMDEYEKMMSGE